MSAIIVAGNEIIPDTLTVTVDGTEITAKDFQKVLLNINQASATASVADGTDLMQKMEIINKNANACDVSFTGEGGATVKNLKQNQSMRLSWTGSFWHVTFGGLLSGTANDGTIINYSTEVTLDEKPVNTVYSTTEQDTGMTWVDGKPIYRRILYSTGVRTYTTDNIRRSVTVTNDLTNVAIIINYYGYQKFTTTTNIESNSPISIPTMLANGTLALGVTMGAATDGTVGITFQYNTGYFIDLTKSVTIYLVLEYTKTTD